MSLILSFLVSIRSRSEFELTLSSRKALLRRDCALKASSNYFSLYIDRRSVFSLDFEDFCLEAGGTFCYLACDTLDVFGMLIVKGCLLLPSTEALLSAMLTILRLRLPLRSEMIWRSSGPTVIPLLLLFCLLLLSSFYIPQFKLIKFKSQ